MKRLVLCLAAMSAFSMANAQITMVENIHPSGDGDPCGIHELNGKIYFNADDNVNGRELWVYDPVANTTQMVYNIGAGSADGLIADFSNNDGVAIAFNGKLYFNGDDGTNGMELWVYDGTNPPSMVVDINAGADGSNPLYFTILNNKIYFTATNATVGRELFVYDPATNIASSVSNIEAGALNSNPWDNMVFNNKIYFSAETALEGRELFVYDPANNTTTLVSDINTGVSPSFPQAFMTAGGKLYFTASTATHGAELYSYSGTGNPTRLTDLDMGIGDGVTGISPGLFNGKIYMGGDNGTAGSELYTYDINTNTSQLVYEINPGSASSYPGTYVNYANKLYFSGSTTTSGAELWMYDGVNPPTMVQDLNPGSSGSLPLLMKVINNTLYLNARNGADGFELFKFYDAAASVKSVSKNIATKVFPTPATDHVAIEIDLTEHTSLNTSIYDVTGKMVYSTGSNEYDNGNVTINIPCSSFAAGAYQYILTDKDGAQLAMGKIMKQ